MILYIIVKRLFQRLCSNVGHPRSWTILLAFTVACTIPGRVALDQFKLVGVPASVRVPDSGSVLDSRPDVGIVGYVASIFGARHQFSGKKSYIDLIFMGRRKCEAVACLSSQVKCIFYDLLYCALYLWRINKFDLI